jgi:hypothetical protein
MNTKFHPYTISKENFNKFLDYWWVVKCVIPQARKSAKWVGYHKLDSTPISCSLKFMPLTYTKTHENLEWDYFPNFFNPITTSGLIEYYVILGHFLTSLAYFFLGLNRCKTKAYILGA